MNKSFAPITKETIENFPRYEYPGSAKGPDPLDDPDHFAEWFAKTYPRDIVEGF